MTSGNIGKRGPYAPSKKRRKVVVKAVLDLVDEMGHEAVTIALVSQRSGVSETTILYHFPSRDHLLIAALALAEDIAAEMSGAETERALLDPAALGAAVADPDDRRSRLHLVLRGHAATQGHPAVEHFARRLSRQVAFFAHLIENSQKAGTMHPSLDPFMTARKVIAVIEGLSQQHLVDSSFDVTSLLQDAVRQLTGQNLVEVQAMLTGPLVSPRG